VRVKEFKELMNILNLIKDALKDHESRLQELELHKNRELSVNEIMNAFRFDGVINASNR
jgi:predicted component of type VI protein secretion system